MYQTVWDQTMQTIPNVMVNECLPWWTSSSELLLLQSSTKPSEIVFKRRFNIVCLTNFKSFQLESFNLKVSSQEPERTWVSLSCNELANCLRSWPTTYWFFSNACSSCSSWLGLNAVRTRFGFLAMPIRNGNGLMYELPVWGGREEDAISLWLRMWFYVIGFCWNRIPKFKEDF